MYVIVAYDAPPEIQGVLRTFLFKQLHRVQNSVFAGELTRIESDALVRRLDDLAGEARIQIWISHHLPIIHHVGAQQDAESSFL